ncbi:MAG TPA: PilZ domain-containing protein [Bryobacteraceae bacterium]|nr:PilZ domain-containing protein [Bryobacteraceae bacterium]
MSTAPAGSPVAAYPDERRSHERFPINLSADFRIIRRGRVHALGSARTVNIASGGVLLEADERLSAGALIELLISWPLRLEGVCPLKLVMLGRIVRSDREGVAVKTKHHEFRTSAIRATGVQPRELKVRSFPG